MSTHGRPGPTYTGFYQRKKILTDRRGYEKRTSK
jgi:hypothetical protein